MLCLYYCYPGMEHVDEAKQIKIDFRPDDPTLERFIAKSEDAGKHIYIEIINPDLFKNEKHMRLLQGLKEYNNWTLQIPLSYLKRDGELDKNKFDAIKDCCNRYMFTDLIGNWEVLQFILSLEPSEVYLTNILAFSLEDAKKVCKDVGIRLYANWAQSAWDDIPAINKFFIRPEDISFYEEFVSGIEFQGSYTIQEVCFKVYTRQYWYGNLSELIIGLGDDLDSRRLPEYFGLLRTNCKKRCITGSNCSACRTMKEFMKTLEKTETILTPPVKR